MRLSNIILLYVLKSNCIKVFSRVFLPDRSQISLRKVNQQINSFLSSTAFNTCEKRNSTLVTLIYEPYATQDPWHSGIPPPPESGPLGCRTWSSLFVDQTLQPIIIDVRSPSEFYRDHIYGAINIPVLSDEERAFVGRLYNQGDRVHARLHGASMVCANISRCLKQLADQYASQLNNLPDSDNQIVKKRENTTYPSFIIYCWRGGQRSASLATILSETGWPGDIYRLFGGYRSWRRLLVRQLDAWPRWCMTNPFWVISGLTGSGKSLILQELHDYGETVLDLESLAMHRGSLFGGGNLIHPAIYQSVNTKSDNDYIPVNCITQKSFETRLHHTLMKNKDKFISSKNIIWLECESRNIGPICQLSDGFWSRLRSTEPNVGTYRIWIDIEEEARVAWILENYTEATQNIPQVIHILKRLQKYHSEKQVNQWIEMVNRGDFTSVVIGLLRQHYDPLYKKSLRQVIHNAKMSGLFHRIHLDSVDKVTIRKNILPQILDLAYSTSYPGSQHSPLNQYRYHAGI
ncbi:unnamed protein product [Heterobilharzia americana]|nr:unnamed protein product [Heterobilharzia americana]